MTDQELRDLIGSLAADTQRYKEEFAAERQKTEAERRKTDKQLRELGKQIGGIHDKFGKFAEGLMLPSLKRVVRKTFGVNTKAGFYLARMSDTTFRLDVPKDFVPKEF